MEEQITGTTQLIGILANPIKHSLSPIMHNEAFKWLGLDYAYLAFEIEPHQLEDSVKGLKALNARGFNVSMPYKTTIIPYLDELTPAAMLSQAVNTVVNENGRLIGHNTDGVGFVQSLDEEGVSLKNKKVFIMGSGGAGTAIQVQCALDKAQEVVICCRQGKSYERAQMTIDAIHKHTSTKASLCDLVDETTLREQLSTSHVLINATNVGMAPFEEQTILTDASLLHSDLIVCDIIYKPRETTLLKLAKEAGCQTINGLGMILYQGAEAFKLWTGKEMPVEKIKDKLFNES